MTPGLAITLMLQACVGAAVQGELMLEGPVQVQVENLGKVEGPLAVVDGVPDAKIQWSAEPESVAHWKAGELHAIGPGEATVRASWNEQTVEWKLVVEPAIMLSIDNPPASIGIGESADLTIAVRGGNPKDAGAVSWATSDPALATVSQAGKLTGVAEGVVYISVKAGKAEAMAEIKVMAP